MKKIHDSSDWTGRIRRVPDYSHMTLWYRIKRMWAHSIEIHFHKNKKIPKILFNERYHFPIVIGLALLGAISFFISKWISVPFFIISIIFSIPKKFKEKITVVGPKFIGTKKEEEAYIGMRVVPHGHSRFIITPNLKHYGNRLELEVPYDIFDFLSDAKKPQVTWIYTIDKLLFTYCFHENNDLLIKFKENKKIPGQTDMYNYIYGIFDKLELTDILLENDIRTCNVICANSGKSKYIDFEILSTDELKKETPAWDCITKHGLHRKIFYPIERWRITDYLKSQKNKLVHKIFS